MNLRPPREGGLLGRWVSTWNPCVSPPLIRPDGHLLPKEKVFVRFAKHWILQLRAGMPFVQNDKKGNVGNDI